MATNSDVPMPQVFTALGPDLEKSDIYKRNNPPPSSSGKTSKKKPDGASTKKKKPDGASTSKDANDREDIGQKGSGQEGSGQKGINEEDSDSEGSKFDVDGLSEISTDSNISSTLSSTDEEDQSEGTSESEKLTEPENDSRQPKPKRTYEETFPEKTKSNEDKQKKPRVVTSPKLVGKTKKKNSEKKEINKPDYIENLKKQVASNKSLVDEISLKKKVPVEDRYVIALCLTQNQGLEKLAQTPGDHKADTFIKAITFGRNISDRLLQLYDDLEDKSDIIIDNIASLAPDMSLFENIFGKTN